MLRFSLMSLPLVLGALGCSDAAKAPPTPAQSGTPTTRAQAVQAASQSPSDTQVTLNGSGCPSGSATSALAPDGKTLTITFDAYTAEVSPTAKLSLKDCQIGIPLRKDRQVALAGFELTGDLTLATEAKAKLMTSHYFQGKPTGDPGTELEQVGPHDGPLALRDEVPPEKLGWSQCGAPRNLNVVTRVRLHGGGGAGKAHPTKLLIKLVEKPCSDG